ncbi:tripartite tricarboxylate transporter TctB family protein [Roseitranquillus sediminis]|uniref:tripartite tricarboxylate transporter TctB family protein n=1 Tax=Roseitranquillus sediminis TaxID=2809051 RepID=UPI001D0C9AE3|nr:tripartite tricarboxylate transporter TctB family protein [Roseitranquillus sediminis]MBM9595412.1 tripartite tricarboxylate transporter TctB family protein [Roseitranquillus sediminis]
MSRTRVEFVVSLLVAVVFAYLFVESTNFSAQSKRMPMWVTGFAVALCLVWALQSGLALARHGAGEPLAQEEGELARLAGVVAAVVGYVLAIGYVGFFSATLVMMPLLAWSLGYRRWLTSLLVTAGFAIVLYAVFRLLLSVPLPPEALLELLTG